MSNFGQMHRLNNPLQTPGFSGQNRLPKLKARSHSRSRIQKPGTQMRNRMLRITCFLCEDKRPSQHRNHHAKFKQSIAMRDKSIGVRRLRAMHIRPRWISRIRPIVLGFGVIVMRGSRAAWTKQRGDGCRRLRNSAFSRIQDAIMVDRGDIRTRSRLGLWQKVTGRQQ